MIAPTKLYDRFPTISPGQAARKVITALVDRPHEINTLTGSLGALAHYPGAEVGLPDAAPRLPGLPRLGRGQGRQQRRQAAPDREQMLLARLLKGVHW